MTKNDVLEKAADISQATTWSGAVVAFISGLNAAEVAAFMGVGVAFLGMIINAGINFYFKYQAHKLAVKKAGLEDERDT